MVSQHSRARSSARRMASCACALALLLSVGWLASCGGGDDDGGGLSGLSKRSAGSDIEGGGPPPPPGPPRPAAPVKKEDPNKGKVMPPTAEELARKRAAWEDFLQHGDNSLVLPSAADTTPRAPAAASIPGMPANLAPAMKSWYSDYKVVSTAVKLALLRYTQAHDAHDDGSLHAACQELKSSTERLFGDPTAFASPDAAVNDALSATYQGFRAAADSCLAGQAADRDHRIAVAQQFLKQAADALRGYQLAP